MSELISDVDARFRTIKDRRARGVAGLSMGGYGALKYGLKHPDLFAFAGSMSGALDPATRTEQHPGFAWNIIRPSINAVFGTPDSQTRKANNLHEIARSVSASQITSLPYLYFDCGLDDGWVLTNRQLADILSAKRFHHTATAWDIAGLLDQQVREVLNAVCRLMTSTAPSRLNHLLERLLHVQHLSAAIHSRSRTVARTEQSLIVCLR